MFYGQFLAYFVVRESIVWCRNHILSPNIFTRGHSIKVEWLAVDVTADESPDRAEPTILGVILAGPFFWSVQVLYDVGTPA